MKLVWARYALDDRSNIFSYIETENPGAAVHVDEKPVLRVVSSTCLKADVLAASPEHANYLSMAHHRLQPTR